MMGRFVRLNRMRADYALPTLTREERAADLNACLAAPPSLSEKELKGARISPKLILSQRKRLAEFRKHHPKGECTRTEKESKP